VGGGFYLGPAIVAEGATAGVRSAPGGPVHFLVIGSFTRSEPGKTGTSLISVDCVPTLDGLVIHLTHQAVVLVGRVRGLEKPCGRFARIPASCDGSANAAETCAARSDSSPGVKWRPVLPGSTSSAIAPSREAMIGVPLE